MGYRIVGVNKDGRKVLSYTISNGTEQRNVDKDTVVKAVESGVIENAKIQWYQGKPIVRVKDEVETKNRRPSSHSGEPRQRKTSNTDLNSVQLIATSNITGDDIFKRLVAIFGATQSDADDLEVIYTDCLNTFDMDKVLNDKVEIAITQDYIANKLRLMIEVRARKTYNMFKYNGSMSEPYKTHVDANGDEVIDLK